MRAGKLRHELIIRSRSDTNDGYGTPGTATVSHVATVWGSVQPRSAREFQTGQQRSSDEEYLVTIRGSSGYTVTPANDILFGSRVFQILGVRDFDERNIMLELDCREILT